ncbi:MAG: lipid kinase [Aurantimonas endophytica]|uniref:YegS/Rv2252/BmrU family lipid kinase n=1 Tax=Aurantimonas endophytica TaxID=1522175 RepID=A0A7W6HAE3_9HYPH|nr:lipid kinase [Aurantimonas endophytica]MBB4001447.1 YegS/Rv2252/BmrU family lipid kinase [Aurantimonas endophytica]MCO6402911.1 lipid kinase [Aurantimonas endophytica]
MSQENLGGTLPKRALVLLNARARSGSDGSAASALDVLRQAGMRLLDPEPGERPFREIIREYAGQADLVVLGGGDGTLRASAAALMEAGLPLGILPLGTANDLARTLTIPTDVTAAAAVIAADHRRAVDLGEVNGQLFFNVASIGFSADLARSLTAAAKKRWGKLGYAIAAFKLLRQSRPFSVEIEHDGVTERVRTVQISVGNGRFYGGGMAVAANAAPDDGLLDVYSLEVEHWWELVALAPSLRFGTQGRWKKVRTFQTTALSLSTRRPHDVNADGDLASSTPASFRIHRKALSVFVPGRQSA